MSIPKEGCQMDLQLQILMDRAEIQIDALRDTLAQIEELAPIGSPVQVYCSIAKDVLC